MQEKIRIVNDLIFTSSLKMLVEVYEEISVIRMQRIRSSVLKTREFLGELSNVFYNVKTSYVKQIMEYFRRKKIKDPSHYSTLPKNGKSVVVFLSANDKLYGDIVPKIFKLFIEQAGKSDSEIVIVGKLGKSMFEESKSKIKYAYFDLNDSKVSFEDLKSIISYILSYEKVTIYYGKFINVITQTPAYSSISGEQPFVDSDKDKKSDFQFIFEPDIEKMLNFFETQIFTSLFKQTIHESQLARYASRILAMEKALTNVESKIKELKNQERKAKRLTLNRKQLDALSGISVWGVN